MTIWLIISAVVLTLALSEFSEISPWAARRLLIWGARRLPGRELSERYREEWLAGIEEVPGKVIKLAKAVSIVCYMVPVMKWRVNGPTYLWPARRIADAAISRVAPSLNAKLRARLIMSYTAYMGVPVKGKRPVFTVRELLDLLNNSPTGIASRHMLPATETFRRGSLVGWVDHRQKRIGILAGNFTEYRLIRIKGLSRQQAAGSTREHVRIELDRSS